MNGTYFSAMAMDDSRNNSVTHRYLYNLTYLVLII